MSEYDRHIKRIREKWEAQFNRQLIFVGLSLMSGLRKTFAAASRSGVKSSTKKAFIEVRREVRIGLDKKRKLP